MFKRLGINLSINYFAFAYQLILNFIFLPILFRELGEDLFGLVGLFLLVQGIFLAVFEPIFTQNLVREIGLNLKANDSQTKFKIIKSFTALEVPLLIILSIIWILIIININSIKDFFFSDIKDLLINDIQILVLIFSTLILRVSAFFYKGGINAFQKQHITAFLDIILNTLRFPIAIASMLFFSGILQPIFIFFIFQLIASLTELIFAYFFLQAYIPNFLKWRNNFSYQALKELMPFSFGMIFLVAISYLQNNLDKVVFSLKLDIVTFGYFTFLMTVLNAVQSVNSPATKAFFPFFLENYSNNKESAINYALKMIGAINCFFIPFCGFLFFYSDLIFYFWIGDEHAVDWISSLMPYYLVGILTIPTTILFGLILQASNQLVVMQRSGMISLLMQSSLILIFFNKYLIILPLSWSISRLIHTISLAMHISNDLYKDFYKEILLKSFAPFFLITLSILIVCQLFSESITIIELFLYFTTCVLANYLIYTKEAREEIK